MFGAKVNTSSLHTPDRVQRYRTLSLNIRAYPPLGCKEVPSVERMRIRCVNAKYVGAVC